MCNYQQSQDAKEYLPTAQTVPHLFGQPLPPPLAPGHHRSISVPIVLLFPERHIPGAIAYVAFSIQLLSLSIMPLRSIRAAVYFSNSSLLIAEQYSGTWVWHNLFTHFPPCWMVPEEASAERQDVHCHPTAMKPPSPTLSVEVT